MEISENNIVIKIGIKLSLTKIKYIGITLPKHVQGHHEENEIFV